MAVKGAVSDALKRSLRTFGNQFGNSLYNKGNESYEEDSPPPPPRPARPRNHKPPASSPKPPPPVEPHDTWVEWAMTIEETSPENFNRVKELVWKEAPRQQRKALVDEAQTRGMDIDRDTGKFYWWVREGESSVDTPEGERCRITRCRYAPGGPVLALPQDV